MKPRIIQDDNQIGFYWTTAAGRPTSLRELAGAEDEIDRLCATHLSALDDALIDVAGRFGALLGGGRAPDASDRADLVNVYRVLDVSCRDYASAAAIAGVTPDARAGKIVGTSALISILARLQLGLLGPAPLDGELDTPELGVIGGYGDFVVADPARPWCGGRWVVRTQAGQRLPLTLETMLFDSSGVDKDAARREHLQALEAVVAGADDPAADPPATACALDWLLYDWLMAHREGPDSAETLLPGDAAAQRHAAAVLIAAVAASVTARGTIDPILAQLLPVLHEPP